MERQEPLSRREFLTGAAVSALAGSTAGYLKEPNETDSIVKKTPSRVAIFGTLGTLMGITIMKMANIIISNNNQRKANNDLNKNVDKPTPPKA